MKKPFWVLDCETDPFKSGRVPQPFLWGLYGGPHLEYYEFSHPYEVVKFLERHKTIVYAHNGGKFDYHYLREYINTGEIISIISGRLARFRIGDCEFRDSMNILPVPLSTYKKDEIDYSIFEPEVRDIPINREAIRKYLRNDCVYLHELICEHRKENGVALTQAGASMRQWSKDSGLSPPRQSGAYYSLYKPYYYGGRVQCFSEGTRKVDFQVIDINSAYPEAMLHAHPFAVSAALQDQLPADGQLHRAMITLRCTARGCFPFRTGSDPTKGDLFFPEDDRTIRRYHITGYEFIAALELDAISNIFIESVHLFSETVKFEDFIRKHWDRRKLAKKYGNIALDIICKLLMNSLYGKFASDYSKYREYLISDRDDIIEFLRKGYEVDTLWEQGRALLSKKIAEDRHRYYNIATAASITGYVRAKLFTALSAVSNPIYCDTDSIACVDSGSLIHGSGLGEWKLEGEFDEYSIVGKKTYSFHHRGRPHSVEVDSKGSYANYKVACKGVDISPEEIRKAALGEVIYYKPEVPTYSIKRDVPIFVDRRVRLTARDIRRVPEEIL